MLTYRGYTAQIQIDLESGMLSGKILDIKDAITFEGRTVDEIKQEFFKSVDVYLALCAELGQTPDKAFSGKLPFRTTPDNHRKIYLAASQANTSINAWMEETLAIAAEKALAGKAERHSPTPLQEYEQEQVLVQLERKINQLQYAVNSYLQTDSPEAFNHFLVAIKPFLGDIEFAALIQKAISPTSLSSS